MVAFEELVTMAPGTSAMLRARRKDINVKPNRLLDKTASRGMLYENEELRLRTININADLEKGQQNIKKLRRENDQLRREIWNLRDQYDRLENVLRNKQQQEYDDEDEEGEEGNEEEYDQNTREKLNTLSTVREEPDDISGSENIVHVVHCESTVSVTNHLKSEASDETKVLPSSQQVDIRPTDQINTQCTILEDHDQQGRIKSSYEGLKSCCNCENLIGSQSSIDKLRCACNIIVNADSPSCWTSADVPPKHSSDNCCMDNKFENTPKIKSSSTNNIHQAAQQHVSFDTNTIVFATQSFEKLTVQEVIDELDSQLKEKWPLEQAIKGVRVSDNDCFISAENEEHVKYLKQKVFKIREIPVNFEDAMQHETAITISTLPYNIPNELITALCSVLGTVQGSVERRTYKGVDIGERTIKIKPSKSIPSVIKPHTAASISRRKSFRSQININLIDPSDAKGGVDILASTESLNKESDIRNNTTSGKQLPSFFSKSTGVILTPTSTQNNSAFPFPTSNNPQTPDTLCPPSKLHSQVSTAHTDCKDEKKVIPDSPLQTRKCSQRRITAKSNNKAMLDHSQSSVAGQESPLKLNRKLSVNFKNASNGEVNARRPSFDHMNYSHDYGLKSCRERSSSDVSSKASICKRKLSATGHEGSGKIPWCGCWGTGCC